MDARNPDGGGSNGEALATIKSDGLMVAWGIANDRRNNRGVQVELAGGIQHINRGDVFARVTSSIVWGSKDKEGSYTSEYGQFLY